MIDAPGRRQDHLRRTVIVFHKGLQIGAGELCHALCWAQNGAAKTLIGVGHLLQPVKDDVVWRVQGLPDFLQDHMAFDLNFLGIKGGVEDDIADHIQCERHVIFQDARVIGRHLARSIGVDIAAHILNFLGNLQGRAPLGAFKRHML